MSSNLEKVKSIFKSPGISAVLRWSKCVHVKVVAVCLITVLAGYGILAVFYAGDEGAGRRRGVVEFRSAR